MAVVIILLASRKSVMGAVIAPRLLIVLGWVTTLVMASAAVRMLMATA